MHQTFFKHQMETRHESKDRRKAEKLKAQVDCYAAVDLRDKSICRVTGQHVTAGHADPHKRREHHHLLNRSLGGLHETRNVITISAFVHSLIHAGKAHLEGDANLRDADGRFCGVTYQRMTESGWQTERML